MCDRREPFPVVATDRIWVTVRGDRACLVAHPSLGFDILEAM